MNISKFTQKSIEAVNGCEKLAMEYGNQEIEEEHLLYALLTQEDSLILKLIEKMEIQKEYFIDTVKRALDARVKVSGGELQRFCIARALGRRTKLLIADEMTTMLDLITQGQIWDFVLKELKRRDIGMIAVSHSPELLEKVCDRVVHLRTMN